MEQMVYGWIECVGHADRACYDLQQVYFTFPYRPLFLIQAAQHSNRTGFSMQASKRLSEAIMQERCVVEPNKKLLGPRFKGDQKTVLALLEALDGDELDNFKRKIESEGHALVDKYDISSDLVSFKMEKKNIVEVK
jgi:glycyl-tRNA synthetase